MKYTLENGKAVNIPDKEIEKNMELLEISKEEAVEMWLCDHDFEDNEELEELDEKASKIKIKHEAGTKERKKSDKPRTVKTSDEKKELFSTILTNLQEVFGENAQVLKENKLISLKIGEKTFKIDIIEQRQPKK
jgi:hypothetical protein